jgi:cysteinyl-tRNA synthetase
MATKYLGKQFDIHGGGMDLLFPHHESEIAQSTICNHQAPVRYWMHNNMITINGRKMGKSYNNVIRLTELFSGTHPLLEKAYHPMTVRFFILQTHYSSTLDFSNEALQAAEKGLKRLWEAYQKLQKIDGEKKGASASPVTSGADGTDEALTKTVHRLLGELPAFMNDDFSTAKVLANLFELVPIINAIYDGHTPAGALSASTLLHLQKEMSHWLETVLGLQGMEEGSHNKLEQVMSLLIDIRKEARGRKDFLTSDKIRDRLASMGIQLKDEKGGEMTWRID